MGMRRLPYRVKLAAAIAAGLLVLVAGMTALGLRIVDHYMREALGKQEYQRARLLAAYYDGLLSTRSMSLATLAESLPGPGTRNDEVMKRALTGQRALSGAFLNLALFAKSGELIYSARPPVSRLYGAGTRPYFIEAVLQKRELLSQPFISALTGTPVVVLAHPLLDAHGQVDYVLVASLALAEAPIAPPAEDGGRFSYVMTSDGYLVSFPVRAWITHHIHELQELSPDAALGLRGQEGWRVNDASGTVHAFAKLRQARWIVGVQAPEQTVFMPLIQLRDMLLRGAMVIALLCIAAAWPLSWLLLPRLKPASAPRPEAATASVPAPAPTPAKVEAIPAPEATSTPPVNAEELDLDAFMQTNFTTDEQRRSFISTITASIRKLPSEVAAVCTSLQTAPAQATALLHTLKGAWGSLGAHNFAHAAARLESAIKTKQPTAALHADFESHATALYATVNAWLTKVGTAEQRVEQAPSAQLLPLLRERNISATVLYEASRDYWDKQLGPSASAFSAAMDALDFGTAERLLDGAATQAQQTSLPVK